MKILPAIFAAATLLSACGSEPDTFEDSIDSQEEFSLEAVEEVEIIEYFVSEDEPKDLRSYGNNVIMRMKACTYVSKCSVNAYGSICAVKWTCPAGFRV